jgi:D-alanine-D-alanine ligase
MTTDRPHVSDDRRIRVLLLFGGRSAEHDVSRVSAVSVGRALDPSRFDVVPVGITRDGRWVRGAAAAELLADTTRAVPEGLPVDGEAIESGTALRTGGRPVGGEGPIDVVIPLLHGPYGEDGTVQGLLEIAGVPYVGSGVVGSAVAMDKVMMKRAFVACGIPTPRIVDFREWDVGPELEARVGRELGFPCFVKPANMGSSIGVSKVTDPTALGAAIATAMELDEYGLIEEAVPGREIEVAVLGDHPPAASIPGEIVPGDEFYTYDDKYRDGVAQLLVPAPLSVAQASEVRELAVAAFAACRCDAMARVDFFFDEGGRGFVCNEVNTIPGFTPISMFPRLWAESGVGYSELVERLVELAIERHARRSRRAGRPRD